MNTMFTLSRWSFRLILALIIVPTIGRCNGLKSDHKHELNREKCKEHVDEALRQYWDHDGEEPEDDAETAQSKEDNHDDEDDHEKNTKDCDDEEEENDEKEEDPCDGDDGKECDEKDNKDDEDNDEENESKEKDDEEEDNDEKFSGKSEVKDKDDEKDKDDDENNTDEEDDEEEEEEKNEKTNPAIGREKEKNTKDDDEEDDSKKDDDDDEKDNDDDKKEDDNASEDEVTEEHRSRSHIDDILRVNEIGSQEDRAEQNLILSIFRELKKIYETAIKPLEMMYKYRHITTRLITDAEIFAKPMVIFLGGKSTGKTSIVNYLLGLESTPWQLKTGLTTSSPHFNILSFGENYSRISPTELAADFAFSSLQQFGQHFLEQYIQTNRMPINILQKMTIIDSPGLIDIITKDSAQQPKGIDSDVYQWFIDRSDVIYIVIDVNQLHLSQQLQFLIEQLKGRDVRFIINKSDAVSHSQIITLIGQLLWILSPIMPAERPPQVYALTTVPQDVYDAFLDDQEQLWLNDLSEQISGLSRVESRIAALRRHAVRVRNHAKLIDCYLAAFYKHKGIFTFGSSSRTLAADITENPHQYRIFSGAVAGQAHNISRYDLPDPGIYKEFFRANPLIDFKPLSSTCSYFKGCPIDKLDLAIAYQLPELIGKYKKLTKMQPVV